MLEELVIGRVHGKAFAATTAEFTERLGLKAIAKCAIMLLVLFPLVMREELDHALVTACCEERCSGKDVTDLL